MIHTPNFLTPRSFGRRVFLSSITLTPSQSIGSNLAVNGDFATWSAGLPTSWNQNFLVATSHVDEVAADGSPGTGSVHIWSTSNYARLGQACLTLNKFYYETIDIKVATNGTITVGVRDSDQSVYSASGAKRALRFAKNTANATNVVQFLTTNDDFVVDDHFIYLITPNTEIVAPSANMRITQYFTLPGSPEEESQLWLMGRISDMYAGSLWMVALKWIGFAWYAYMILMSAGGKTTKTSAAVGTPNGLRFTLNGTSLKMETTTDGGANWTARGTTVTDATFQTATGANVIWTPDFTMGDITVEQA